MSFTRVIVLLTILMSSLIGTVAAQEERSKAEGPPLPDYVQGVVLTVNPINKVGGSGESRSFAGDVLQVRLVSGSEAGQEVRIINYRSGMASYDITVKPDDKVLVAVTQDMGRKQYNLAGFYRLNYIYWLVGIFVAALVLAGGKVGVKSVFVIAFSLFLIFQVFVSQVLAMTWNITVLTFVISAIIAFVTQVVVSGWNSKTLGAVIGTVGGVAVAGAVSAVSIRLMHLTGLDSEEAMMLKVVILPNVDFQGILFAGIVLGSLGAVMDVAISISSAIYEIKTAQPAISFREMVRSGTNVGRDVMGTMANTLILAYAGSSLPLILLIMAQKDKSISLENVLNLNIIGTEVVRALTGSIGLIASIPITILVTAFLLRNR